MNVVRSKNRLPIDAVTVFSEDDPTKYTMLRPLDIPSRTIAVPLLRPSTFRVIKSHMHAVRNSTKTLTWVVEYVDDVKVSTRRYTQLTIARLKPGHASVPSRVSYPSCKVITSTPETMDA